MSLERVNDVRGQETGLPVESPAKSWEGALLQRNFGVGSSKGFLLDLS